MTTQRRNVNTDNVKRWGKDIQVCKVVVLCLCLAEDDILLEAEVNLSPTLLFLSPTCHLKSGARAGSEGQDSGAGKKYRNEEESFVNSFPDVIQLQLRQDNPSHQYLIVQILHALSLLW